MFFLCRGWCFAAAVFSGLQTLLASHPLPKSGIADGESRASLRHLQRLVGDGACLRMRPGADATAYLHAVLNGVVDLPSIARWSAEECADGFPPPSASTAAEHAPAHATSSANSPLLTPADFRMLFLNYVKEEAEAFFTQGEVQQILAQAASTPQSTKATPASSPRAPAQSTSAAPGVGDSCATKQPQAQRVAASATSAPGALDESNFPSLGAVMARRRDATVRRVFSAVGNSGKLFHTNTGLMPSCLRPS